MICLRCGYCCLTYSIMVVKDPDKEIIEENMLYLDGTRRCPHLQGNKVGEYSCSIHSHSKYKETPCFDFGQIEKSPKDKCRIGEYWISKNKSEETKEHLQDNIPVV